jgi:hypothetical protein
MDSVSTVFSWVMDTDTLTLGHMALGHMTGVMIVQSTITIPVTFVVRAVLGAFRWEKRKGGKDEPLPEEDIAGH